MDKEITRKFLDVLFKDHLQKHNGYIELRQFNPGQSAKQGFFNNIDDVINSLGNYTGNIAYGIAPRGKKEGKKSAVKYITTLWVDVDYGQTGHKKISPFETERKALNHIKKFALPPSIIVNSGYGFHLYWLLKKGTTVDIETENTLTGLIMEMKGDGCGDLPRVFRLPGTINYKDRENPIQTILVKFAPDIKYDLKDFKKYKQEGRAVFTEGDIDKIIIKEKLPLVTLQDLQAKRLTPVTLENIINGDTVGQYPSRSERDQATIVDLLSNKFTNEQIKAIFSNPEFTISDKYLAKGSQGDYYLKYSIFKAEQYLKTKDIIPIVEKHPEYVNIPKDLYKFLNTYLAKDDKLLPKDFTGYKEINDGEHCLIYRRELVEKGRTDIKEYSISKAIGDPAQKIPLDTMRKVYNLSFFIAQILQKSNTIVFTLQDIIPFIYGKNAKISGNQRKELALAEKLLFYTTYRRYTKEKGKEIENLQHLYSGIKITTEKGKTFYQVTLNRSYFEEMSEDTGFIQGQYIQEALPLKEPKNTKERFIRRSLSILNNMGRWTPQHPGIIIYKVITHLEKIGVKQYDLDKV